MVLTDTGASIQGKKVAFQCRKFTPQRPYKETKLDNKVVYPAKLKIFGIAIIDVELNPKKCFYPKSSALNKDDEIHGSALNKDDEIHGSAIKVFSIKPIPDMKVKAATGRHKANFSYSKDKTYAEIEIPVKHHL